MITIDPAAEAKMNEDARNSFPDECCGFMYGTVDSEGNRWVQESLPINNAATENRKRRFQIAPKDYLRGEQYAIEKGLDLLGIYHSHPDHPAIPSEHDRVAAQPWFSYVIISVGKDQVNHTRSWILNDDFQFDEETYNQTIKTNQ